MRGAGWLTQSLDRLVETRLAFLFLLPAVLWVARWLSSRSDGDIHAAAEVGLRARQAANASRSPHRRASPSPFNWRARLLELATTTHAATPGGARRGLRRSPSRTPSVGAAGRVR